MRLAVITPVGPGHEQASRDCAASVQSAWLQFCGPFTSMVHEVIDDTDGMLGRSLARNSGIDRHPDANWFFFIDADDLMHLRAIEALERALIHQPSLEVVFGAVCTDRNGIIDDNVYPLDWWSLLRHGANG